MYNPNLHNIARSDRVGFTTKNPIALQAINVLKETIFGWGSDISTNFQQQIQLLLF